MSGLTLRAALAVLFALSVTGCHAKFKKAAPGIDQVRTQTYAMTPPHVFLGKMVDDGPVGIIVNVAQGVNEVAIRRRIQDAVDREDVATALHKGVAEGLGDGPPFSWTAGREADATVQLEVANWGLEAYTLGAQGRFTYDVRVRVYTASGKRVYSARTNCDSMAGDPHELSQALGLVSNVDQIMEMEDHEIQAAFEEVARWCGMEIAMKMRQHGG
ncbi:MAG: hypothetical protein JRJ84_16805 [Deltaproteobacteria bacterium]|nr:hypothetical protein [Deltaproteobacteria bacterium]